MPAWKKLAHAWKHHNHCRGNDVFSEEEHKKLKNLVTEGAHVMKSRILKKKSVQKRE